MWPPRDGKGDIADRDRRSSVHPAAGEGAGALALLPEQLAGRVGPELTNRAARQETQGKWTGSGQPWHQPSGQPGTCADRTSHNSNNRRTCRDCIGRGPHSPRTARRTVPRDTCSCRAIAVCVWPCPHKSRILESVWSEIIPEPPPTWAADARASSGPGRTARNCRRRRTHRQPPWPRSNPQPA